MPPDRFEHTATPAPRPGMVSLYANLLDPSSTSESSTAASISRAPVVFKQDAADEGPQEDNSAKKQQINPAALRFQPTKRPQPAVQKAKPKASIPRPVPNSSPATAPSSTSAARPPVKSSLADWTGVGDDDDVNGFYGGEKRQRGGRKKRKKNKDEIALPQNWDDIYDPSRPNNYEEYKHSDERIREVREWKDRLYAHRMARRRGSDEVSEDDTRGRATNGYAPPPSYSFAPPPSFDVAEAQRPPPPPPPPAEIPDDPSGEDAYARRIRLSQQQSIPPYSAPAPISCDQAVAQSGPAPTISRAPVRYNLPAAPAEIPATEAELEEALEREEPANESTDEAAPRSLRPGQKGFAERVMSKYGWTKGSGLGASGSGILNPLRVQVEKQKKKPDAEGGGFVGPGGRGKIIGGKKKGGDGSDEGKFGAMSEVVILRGMVDGMDLDAEMEAAGDGGLMQEIGEECGDKYGRVERVFIDRSTASAPKVFVRFTSQLSALRAVNALEGRIFNGNTINARFFDTEKFEGGDFE